MGGNNKKRLKKEVILTSIVILELIVVYICIIAVKVSTDNQSQEQIDYGSSIINSSKPVVHATPTPQESPNASATKKPSPEVTNKPVKPNTPDPTTKPVKTSTPKPTKKPVSSHTDAKDNKLSDATKKLFSDSVFLGDSRTEGLQLKTGLSSAKFITHRGLTVSTAMTQKVIKLKNGEQGTILDALKEGTYKKVFVMFGVNELGWPYTSTFTTKYKELINEIKKIQPDAKIYVQSIIPVTKAKSDSSQIYNLKNVKKFNKAIKAMTKELHLQYLNVQEAVTKTNTYLPEDFATDGVHLTKTACFKWLGYLTDKIS